MNRVLIVFAATLVFGCAAPTQEQSSKAMTAETAIEDFIEVEALTEIDAIRSMQQLHHRVITDKYIIIHDRRASYLAAFSRRCRELNERDVTPDIRRERNTLRAKTDSFRGCRIDSIYEVSAGQADELKSIGEMPGK